MLLVKANYLEEFENFLLDILTVCLSQTEGNKIDSLEKCPSEEERIRLISNIRDYKCNEDIQLN